MKKADRQKIYDKYAGLCAYCGCKLEKGWHVDEIIPCRRLYTHEMPRYELPQGCDKNSTEEEITAAGGYKYIKEKKVFVGYENAAALNIDNQMPACPSCNINKHSMSLEQFRELIAGFKKHLNQHSVQYKISKRFGLINEIDKSVVFYFETLF